MKAKRSQQEMVGFVLIVVLVVIGMLIFLVISVRKSSGETKSVEVENMLAGIMKQTTNCAIVYEPDYDNVKDLVKSCYENEKCSNLDKMACDYLNETLKEIMDTILETESVINAYQLKIFRDTEDSEILKIEAGMCEGVVAGAQEVILADSGKIIIRLKVCYSKS